MDPIYQCEKTIMIRSIKCFVLAGVVLTAASVGTAPAAYAQCDTCATPTVAYYQPTVAYQPVATQVVRTGWYPGRWFDRMRMRRWGVSTAATPTYAVGYAPAGYAQYGAAYTPYTAAYAYAPTSYTAAYRPYVTSYAPLARTAYYYPAATTVARQVVMRPMVSACNACGTACVSCSSCSSCDGGVSQAVYGAPVSGCSTCAVGTSVPTYSGGSTVGPPTPQPQLAPNEGTPESSLYESQRLESNGPTLDPSPESDPSTYYEAPKLFNPRDRTANRPSVEVHNAVYSQQVTHHAASHVPASEVDANGWYAVSADR